MLIQILLCTPLFLILQVYGIIDNIWYIIYDEWPSHNYYVFVFY